MQELRKSLGQQLREAKANSNAVELSTSAERQAFEQRMQKLSVSS